MFKASLTLAAHGGSFAAGSALAIDDAFALYLSIDVLLKQTRADSLPSAEAIASVLEMYNSVRRRRVVIS